MAGCGAPRLRYRSSEITHVLETQALIQRRLFFFFLKTGGEVRWARAVRVTAKDMILALIGHVGAAGGTGYAVGIEDARPARSANCRAEGG